MYNFLRLQGLPLALRLYPRAFTMIRIAIGPDRAGDLENPCDAVLTIAPWVLHRHRRHWRDPDGFDPSRFLPAAPPPPRLAYLRSALGRASTAVLFTDDYKVARLMPSASQGLSFCLTIQPPFMPDACQLFEAQIGCLGPGAAIQLKRQLTQRLSSTAGLLRPSKLPSSTA
jgi:hypothetical protein